MNPKESTSPTYSHAVALTDLIPATTYYYQIVSTNSTVNQFFSPRQPGDNTPFTLNAVIDLGVYGRDGYAVSSDPDHNKSIIPSVDPSLNHSTIGRLSDTMDDFELVIHPGDFAYADDWFVKPHNFPDGKAAYQGILHQFYNQLEPISSRKPYMVGPGNHDTDCTEIPFTSGLCPEGQRNFSAYTHWFGNSMPTAFGLSLNSIPTSPTGIQDSARRAAQHLSKPPFWYSFEYGMVHVTVIDTETDFPTAPDGPDGSAKLNSGPFGAPNQQLDFLQNDLASVDRSLTPWLIVTGHRPLYSLGSDACQPCRDAFESLFFRYGVDVGVFGHEHNSQRLAPVVNDTVDPNGMDDPAAPMYIVAGGAGNVEGVSGVDIEPDLPAYAAWSYTADWSYGALRVMDRNRLQVDFVRSATGEVLDSSVLFKGHYERFVNQN